MESRFYRARVPGSEITEGKESLVPKLEIKGRPCQMKKPVCLQCSCIICGFNFLKFNHR